jgi:hypothetical protein
MPDSVFWRWTEDRMFMVASAYAIQFEGATRAGTNKLIWKSDVTLRCKIFLGSLCLESVSQQTIYKRGFGLATLCIRFAKLSPRLQQTSCTLFLDQIAVDVGAGTLSVATHTESSGQRFDAD